MTVPCLVARELWFDYEIGGDGAALRGIDVAIGAGELVALIGQNGSGKTTLAKHFNGLLRASRGTVSVEGVAVDDTPVAALARRVGYVFQNPDHQIFSPTVREEVAFGPRNLGLSPVEIDRRVEAVLRELGLEAHAERQPAVLSFGLRRKVAVAAVLAMDTPVLVLDEPTAGLDADNVDALMACIRSRHRAGRTIVIITHDMNLVAAHMPRCVVLDRGRVILDEDTRRVFGEVELLREMRLATPQVAELGRRLAPIGMPSDVLTVTEFCAALERLERAGANI